MIYSLHFTDAGWDMFINSTEYLLYKVGSDGNTQAARSFLADFDKTINMIQDNPESYALCELERYRKIGLRKAHLKQHNYKVIFHTDDNTIMIDAVFHDKQDYENLL